MTKKYESVWLKALTDQPHYGIGNIQIKALSNWHLFVLESRRNRMVCKGLPPARVCDALEVIAFCSRDMVGGIHLVNNRDIFVEVCQNISRSVGLSGEETVSVVRKFLNFFIVAPDRFKRPGKSAGAPHSWYIVKALCDVYNMGLEEAWNSRYNLGRAYFDVQQEDLGRSELVSDEDIFRTQEALAIQENNNDKCGRRQTAGGETP